MKIYGYYDSAAHNTPTYDPPHDAPCVICDKPITADNVRTIGMMMEDRKPPRSYFYRVHRTCHSGLNQDEQNAIDNKVWDIINADKITSIRGDNQ